MEVKFRTGIKHFRLEDVYRYQEYPGTDNRWSECAFLFRDGSILWEMMGFTTYAADGSSFSTGGFVHHNGAQHLPGRMNGEFPQEIYSFIKEIKEKGVKDPILTLWEMPILTV
jgi:hypothetical protein